jgi:hypothetical protein
MRRGMEKEINSKMAQWDEKVIEKLLQVLHPLPI